MKLRRLGQRILIGIGLSVVLAVALVAAIAIVRVTVGSKELARQLGAIASRDLVDPSTTRIRIGDLSGNPLTGIRLHDVRVEVRGEDHLAADGGVADQAARDHGGDQGAVDQGGESAGVDTTEDAALPVTEEDRDGGWVPFLAAPAIQLDYRVTEFSRQGPRLRSVQVIKPEIFLPPAGGRWPGLKPREAGQDREKGSRGFTLTVERLELTEALLHRDTTQVDVSLDAGLEVGGGYVALAIDSLAVETADRPAVTATGRAEVRGSAVYLDELRLSTGGSQISLTGALDGTRGAALRIVFDPIDLADARAASGSPLLDRPGSVRGTATLDGDWHDLNLGIELAATIGRDSIEDFTARGRITGSAVEILEAGLVLNGVPLSGSGRVGRGETRGDSYGTLAFEAVDLTDFPVLRDLSWMPSGQLSGTITVSAEADRPEGRLRPFDLEVTRGVVGGFVLAPGHFQGAVSRSGVIHLDDYEVTTRGAVIVGSGRIDPRGDLALSQELEISDLRALGGMVGERRFGGRGRARFDLAGPVRAPGFTFSGFFDSLAAEPARLRQATVEITGGTIRPRFTFDVQLDAEGGTFAGQPLTGFSLAAGYESGRVEVRDFLLDRGSAELAAIGDVEFQQGIVDFDLSRLALRVGDQRWVSREPVLAVRRGSVWAIDELSLTGPGGSFSVSGTVDPDGFTTDVELAVRDLDLAEIAAGRVTDAVGGQVDLDLRVRGAGESLAIEFSTAADSLVWKRFLAKRIEVDGDLSNRALNLERVRFERGGDVVARGWVRFSRPLAGFSDLRTLAGRAAWEEAEIDLTARAEELELAAWHGLHRYLDQLGGQATVSVSLTGSPASPDGAVTLRAEEFVVGSEELGPIDARGYLDDGWLRIDEAHLSFAGQPFTARGLSPVRLAVLSVPVLDREAPLALSLELTGANLALVRLLTGRVADAEGVLDGAITLTGSLDRPHVHGAVKVKDGRVVVTDREEIFENLTGEIAMDGRILSFTDVTATDGGKGRLRASGAFEIEGRRLIGYDVTVNLSEFSVRSSGEYQGTIDGTFTFRRGRLAGLADGLPDFSGDVRVRRLDYLREIVGGGGTTEPGPSSWVGRFTIELPRNVWIRNTDLEVELKGQLTYERDVAGRTVLGRLETVRGRYDLFGHTFRITSGEILFTDPESVDPEVNVTAETRVPEARIFATISGRASDRQVILSSDPDYDQATLWRFLVPSQPEDVTNLVALTPIVQELERALSREVPGLSLRVESRTPEGATDPKLGARVGTYVSPEIFVSAYQSFSSSYDQDVSVEYELSDLFFLEGSIVRRGVTENRGGRDFEQEYNLDLNLRWEF